LRALQKFVVLFLGLGLSTAAWADDFDADLVDDTSDNCPYDYNPDQTDSDCDGEGDACQSLDHGCLTCCEAGGGNPVIDTDEDGIDDDHDNCVNGPNPLQEDSDCDTIGDPCDFHDDNLCVSDADRDGVLDDDDNGPVATNPVQEDADCDGLGDVCDPNDTDGFCDADADGVGDDDDNCPGVANTSQADGDCDDIGDACDGNPNDSICDVDDDLVADSLDNCPAAANTDQADTDCDLVGDACDADSHDGLCGDHDYDGDGVPEALDVCPDDDATGHDLYLDGCVDTIFDFSPYIRTLAITKKSAETALTVIADSAANSAERGQPKVAELKLKALTNLAKALNKTANITNDQFGLIVRFSDDVGDDL
jgi:hypothetical protein